MSIEIPPRGTRGMSIPGGALLTKLFRPLMALGVSRYRRSAKGPEQPQMMGFPVVLLTTVGARTGEERTHVLGGFPDGENAWLVVASNGGAAAHPAWFINLARNSNQVRLEVGNRKLKVTPELLTGQRREGALARIVAIAPRYGGYQRRTDRQIPIIRLTPAN